MTQLARPNQRRLKKIKVFAKRASGDVFKRDPFDDDSLAKARQPFAA